MVGRSSSFGRPSREKTSWMGAVSIEQKTGYGMLSSMLLEPGYFPVDLLEFIPGMKSREIGRLEGGFVSDLGYECAVGLNASLQAGYVGKRTDLRHSAFGMDLRVEPTVTYVMDDDMGFAAAYVFRLKRERIDGHALPADGRLAPADGLFDGATHGCGRGPDLPCFRPERFVLPDRRTLAPRPARDTGRTAESRTSPSDMIFKTPNKRTI